MPRVLVIDDQDHVGTATVLALQAKGFDVVAAESGPSGLTKFAIATADMTHIMIHTLMLCPATTSVCSGPHRRGLQ